LETAKDICSLVPVDVLVTALQSSLQFSPRMTGIGNYWCAAPPFSLQYYYS